MNKFEGYAKMILAFFIYLNNRVIDRLSCKSNNFKIDFS